MNTVDGTRYCIYRPIQLLKYIEINMKKNSERTLNIFELEWKRERAKEREEEKERERE